MKLIDWLLAIFLGIELVEEVATVVESETIISSGDTFLDYNVITGLDNPELYSYDPLYINNVENYYG